MVTIEQKADLFSELLYQNVQSEIKDQTNQFNEKKASLLEQAEAEAAKKAHVLYTANEKKINRKKNELITRSKIEKKKEIIGAKEACINQMTSKIEERAKAFVITTDYIRYIENCMEQVIKLMGTQNPLEVFIMEDDRQKFKELLNKNRLNEELFSIKTAQNNIIGGLVVVDSKTHTRVDFSIQTRLNEMKPFIINQVMEALEEVGEYRE